MPTYEYKILTSTHTTWMPWPWREPELLPDFEKQVNALTTQGWEVFSTDTTSFRHTFLGIGRPNSYIMFVLRRPRTDS